MTSVRRILWRTILGLALPAVLVAAWWLATRHSTSVYWTPFQTIIKTIGPTWFHGRITSDIVPSLLRLLIGYALAVGLGVSLGILTGLHARTRAFLEPVLEFFRATPPPIAIPILILFAGIGDTMKVLVIVFGCVWPILLNTAQGVRSLDPTLRDTARSLRLRPRSQLVHLILPGASPQIAAGARQALSVGLVLMVISEMFAASNGIGYSIIQFQRNYDIPQMWSGIVLLGIIGAAIALVFRLVEARWLAWYHGSLRAQRGQA